MIRRTITVAATLVAVVTGVVGFLVSGASAQGYPPAPPVDPPPVVNTLPPAQVPGVPNAPELVKLPTEGQAALSPAVLATLSPQQLAALSPELAQLSPEELAALSPEQLAQAIQLGRTGADFAPWVLVALFSIALGTVLVVANRRRNRVSA